MDTVSKELFERARMSIPGGVNSPARAFRAVGGNPIFVQQAHGSHLLSVDGTEYIDYLATWGPAIVGHAHPTVIRAVQEAATRGLSFGTPTKAEVVFAEQIRRIEAERAHREYQPLVFGGFIVVEFHR